MSYFADHLAWQQRVAQEFKASSHFSDKEASAQSGSQFFRYPDLVNYMMNTESGSATQPIQFVPGGSNGVTGALNGGSQYGYAPKSRVGMGSRAKKSGLRRSHTGNKYQTSQTSSVVSGTYLPPTRSAFKQTANAENFAAYQQKVRNSRFNEDLDTKSNKGSVHMSAANLRKTFGDKKSTGARSIASGSRYSRPKSSSNYARSLKSAGQNTSVEVHKKRILEVVDQLNEDELEKVSEMLRDTEIVQAPFPNAQDGDAGQVEAEEAEAEDQVEPLEDKEDALTSVSRQPSQTSALTSKTFISQLQSQLNEERQARLDLEEELKQLKAISSDIQSHLKLKSK